MSNIVNLFELPKCEQQYYLKIGIEYISGDDVVVIDKNCGYSCSNVYFDKFTLKVHHSILPAISHHNGSWFYYNQGNRHRMDGPCAGVGDQDYNLWAINGKIFISKEEWEVEKYLLEHPELRAFT